MRFACGFWMGKYATTQLQWQVVMNSNPSKFVEPRQPLEMVSWHDAEKFVDGLNKLRQGVFRLPTEAQWEYACRGDTTTAAQLATRRPILPLRRGTPRIVAATRTRSEDLSQPASDCMTCTETCSSGQVIGLALTRRALWLIPRDHRRGQSVSYEEVAVCAAPRTVERQTATTRHPTGETSISGFAS